MSWLYSYHSVLSFLSWSPLPDRYELHRHLQSLLPDTSNRHAALQSEMDPTSTGDLHATLGATELLQYLNHNTLAKLLRSTTEETLRRGKNRAGCGQRPLAEDEATNTDYAGEAIILRPAILIILEGTVNAYISSHQDASTTLHHDPWFSARDAEKRRLFKLINPVSILNLMAHLTKLLSKDLTHESRIFTKHQSRSIFGTDLVTFEAATQVKLAIVSLTNLVSETPEAIPALNRAILRRLFFVSLPRISSHLRLDQEVLECEKRLLTYTEDEPDAVPYAELLQSLRPVLNSLQAGHKPGLPNEPSWTLCELNIGTQSPQRRLPVSAEKDSPKAELPRLQTVHATEEIPMTPLNYLQSPRCCQKPRASLPASGSCTKAPNWATSAALWLRSCFARLASMFLTCRGITCPWLQRSLRSWSTKTMHLWLVEESGNQASFWFLRDL